MLSCLGMGDRKRTPNGKAGSSSQPAAGFEHRERAILSWRRCLILCMLIVLSAPLWGAFREASDLLLRGAFEAELALREGTNRLNVGGHAIASGTYVVEILFHPLRAGTSQADMLITGNLRMGNNWYPIRLRQPSDGQGIAYRLPIEVKDCILRMTLDIEVLSEEPDQGSVGGIIATFVLRPTDG